MKVTMIRTIALTSLMAIGMGAMAQIPKIKKPAVKVEAPKINTGSSSSNQKGGNVIPQDDPSGLFKKVTDDVNAQSHRRNAVASLNSLTAEYEKSSVDYTEVKRLIKSTEASLGFVMKLEPEVDRSPFDAKYQPLKTRGDKEVEAFTEAQQLENLFSKEFIAKVDYRTPSVASFRDYEPACYCRNRKENTKTYDEYVAAKKKYEELTAGLVGYKNPSTQERFKAMETCLENGNKYAQYASAEGYDKTLIVKVNEVKDAEPNRAIKYCDEYMGGLERIETDYSLNLSAEAKSALASGKSKVAAQKKELEDYISSGRYQAYLDKVHAEKIAKVFVPAAGSKNPTLEAGAVSYVKGPKYKEQLAYEKHLVASTGKVVTVSEGVNIAKNDVGIPKWKYYEMAVSYKGTDGKCYLVSVYAQYDYMGGGTYSQTPKWSNDAPDEMACANLTK